MPAPPFASPGEHEAGRGDAALWGPTVAEVLARHGLGEAGEAPRAGHNPTYPTFVVGGVVVKLFGGFLRWREAYAAERAAYGAIDGHAGIRAPRLLAHGALRPGGDEPWPYLVLSRVEGVAWQDAGLAPAEQRALAAALGAQVRCLHDLEVSRGLPCVDATALDVPAAARRSSLAPHLVAQVADHVARLGPAEPVFVHGDLCGMHVFVEDGGLTGLIDWGDAARVDPHYELIQIHRDTFGCDRELLGLFLDAAHWKAGPGFAHRALGWALVRQAVGLTQHYGMDVFEPIAARYPLDDIPTLDDLADLLFGV